MNGSVGTGYRQPSGSLSPTERRLGRGFALLCSARFAPSRARQNYHSWVDLWKGIAVDDFPALASLYEGALDQGSTKRPGSGEVGAAAAEVRAIKSLVMRVERVSATAYLWSFLPWSTVRRYRRVHVKRITLRLRQVNGILNFSFLALGRLKGLHSEGPAGRSDGGMSDLDGFDDSPVAGSEPKPDPSAEDESQAEEHEKSSPVTGSCRGERGASEIEAGDGGGGEERGQQEADPAEEQERHGDEAEELRIHQDESESVRGGFDTMSEGGGATRGRGLRLGLRGRRFPPSWIASGASSGRALERPAPPRNPKTRDMNGDEATPPLGPPNKRPPPAEKPPAGTEQQQPRSRSGSQHLSGSGGRNGASEQAAVSGAVESAGGEGEASGKPAENVGNFGIVKDVREAFMRRYNAYAGQVRERGHTRGVRATFVPSAWCDDQCDRGRWSLRA